MTLAPESFASDRSGHGLNTPGRPVFDTSVFFDTDAGLFGASLGLEDDADEMLLLLAQRLRDDGRHVMGHIQIRGAAQGDCRCRLMHLVDLATGQQRQISENRGPSARGCHLDWSALTEAASAVERALSPDTDLLIVNRFGRAEAEGKGLRGAIEKAIALEVPVLVGVRPTYAEAWAAFHGGMAVPVTLLQPPLRI